MLTGTDKVFLQSVFDQKRKEEFEFILNACRDKQFELVSSIPTFHPVDEDINLYEDLVEKNLMVRNPLELKSYMFIEDYKSVYMHQPSLSISPSLIDGKSIVSSVENK